MQEWPLTAGKYEVSGSVSSPSRGAFHLSLTVLVHYRSLLVFSLGEWSPQLPTRFHVPRGTQDTHRNVILLALQDCHLLWLRFPTHSGFRYIRVVGPTTPLLPLAKKKRFGLFPVRSPLLRESHVDFFSSGY